jgi:NAD(P)H-dependent flavin oxidoreductase YrpB (nitropropane dioxygenase family)
LELPTLKIGNLTARYPFVQGGMAVRVSTGPLAAAVAEAGGVGTIAGTGMTPDELRGEIRHARSKTKGIIGVNVLFAVRNFAELVKTAISERVDFIVSGAGFSRDMFAWGKESGTSILPIVSSAKLARIATSLGAAAIVVEGAEAGGHLGTDRPIREVLPEVRQATSLPLIAAGGSATGEEAADLFARGAQGVQLATRFIASEECTAADEFKKMHLRAKEEDIVLVESPVGMTGRAIRNRFTEALSRGELVQDVSCDDCLKRCTHAYCILDALDRSRKGDVDHGVVFSGASAARINDILPVREIIAQLVAGATRRLREIQPA